MTLMMYCVMVFSVLCVIILRWGGPFLTGVVIAYIASGFFVVFFTTSFLEFAACMRIPDLWAGMGRAVNNLVAALITNSSVTLLLSGRNLTPVSYTHLKLHLIRQLQENTVCPVPTLPDAGDEARAFQFGQRGLDRPLAPVQVVRHLPDWNQ